MWPSRNMSKDPGTHKGPGHPALDVFEALGAAGLESASACGLVAEGP